MEEKVVSRTAVPEDSELTLLGFGRVGFTVPPKNVNGKLLAANEPREVG
jgi:hypothetical protein